MWSFTNNRLQDAAKEITQAEQPDEKTEDFRAILERNLEILRRYGRHE